MLNNFLRFKLVMFSFIFDVELTMIAIAELSIFYGFNLKLFKQRFCNNKEKISFFSRNFFQNEKVFFK